MQTPSISRHPHDMANDGHRGADRAIWQSASVIDRSAPSTSLLQGADQVFSVLQMPRDKLFLLLSGRNETGRSCGVVLISEFREYAKDFFSRLRANGFQRFRPGKQALSRTAMRKDDFMVLEQNMEILNTLNRVIDKDTG